MYVLTVNDLVVKANTFKKLIEELEILESKTLELFISKLPVGLHLTTGRHVMSGYFATFKGGNNECWADVGHGHTILEATKEAYCLYKGYKQKTSWESSAFEQGA